MLKLSPEMELAGCSPWSGRSFPLVSFELSLFLWAKLGFFLLFPFAFVFLS